MEHKLFQSHAWLFYEEACKSISKHLKVSLIHLQGKMLDMVFAVDDAISWHKENLKCNESHYSFLRRLGPEAIAHVQQSSAGVYYNTLLHIDSQVCMGYSTVSG